MNSVAPEKLPASTVPRQPQAEVLLEHPLPPVRGLVPTHNVAGKPFRVTESHRCFNFLWLVHQIEQCDILVHGPILPNVQPILTYIRHIKGTPASIRSDCTHPPHGIGPLLEHDLESLLLTPRDLEAPFLNEWLCAARDARLPVRLQITGAHRAVGPPETAVQRWREAGVSTLTFAAVDPFLIGPSAADATTSNRILEYYNNLARAALDCTMAVSFVGYPATAIDDSIRKKVHNINCAYGEHQHYHEGACKFSEFLFHQSAVVARFVLIASMASLSHWEDPVDRFLMDKVEKYHKILYKPVQLVSKTRRMLFPSPRYTANYGDTAMLQSHVQDRFSLVFPGTSDACPPAALPPRGKRLTFFDETNLRRLHDRTHRQTLANRALEWQRNEPPTAIWEQEYGVENGYYSVMSGARKWFSGSAGEKISTPLPWLSAPYLVNVTFGGGLAELIGFRINRTQAVLCPVVAPSHALTLFVDEEGRYVLLRDEEIIEPVAVEGQTRLPIRMPTELPLFLSIWNIHDSISVTPLRVWSGKAPYLGAKAGIKYSIAVFCSRFARRLAAALASIAHQRDFDLGTIEVLVAYVPGLDPTEDVLDSIRVAHPELRVVHVPLTAQNVRSKGYALNEALKMASGDWIMLMDADILLPPHWFRTIDPLTDDHQFLAPVGRAMLSRETTARILLGEIEPWADWEALLEQAVEVRDLEARGVPIGFSQIFKKSCLDKVSYNEYEHFQGADWEFGRDMRQHFGEEHRVDIRVLHLDHGGSQWYGVQKQF